MHMPKTAGAMIRHRACIVSRSLVYEAIENPSIKNQSKLMRTCFFVTPPEIIPKTSP